MLNKLFLRNQLKKRMKDYLCTFSFFIRGMNVDILFNVII